MIISYKFDGKLFSYDVFQEDYEKAIKKILLEQSKEDLVNLIMFADMCYLDLEKELAEELREHFEDIAYREYLDRRYE